MRVVVTGASGNVGWGTVNALSGEPAVGSILGLARRAPSVALDKVEWRSADVTRDDLVPLFRGADAVVHLVWVVQPSHDVAALHTVNVGGTSRVLAAVAAAGVPVLVCESSFGAYSPGPKDARVDESWPTHGIPGSPYSQQKAYVERLLDSFEAAHPGIRLVRFRSALVMASEAGPEGVRLYGGRLVPRPLLRPGVLPALPDTEGMRTQAVHPADVGDAYRRALLSAARGPFNLAAEPVLDGPTMAAALGARRLAVPAPLLRAAVACSWHLRLQPTGPEWVDLILRTPLLDTARARLELGWAPRRSATDALVAFLQGAAGPGGAPTPPLADRR